MSFLFPFFLFFFFWNAELIGCGDCCFSYKDLCVFSQKTEPYVVKKNAVFANFLGKTLFKSILVWFPHLYQITEHQRMNISQMMGERWLAASIEPPSPLGDLLKGQNTLCLWSSCQIVSKLYGGYRETPYGEAPLGPSLWSNKLFQFWGLGLTSRQQSSPTLAERWEWGG